MSDNSSITPPVAGEMPGLKPGEIFWNNYRIIGAIGKGGVSTVYKAEKIDNKQLVAVKVLHAHKMRDEELVRRFVRECQTTTQFDHPHAIKILEWGIDQQERPFMVIEYLGGDTLAKRIQRSNGLHWAKAVEIMEQICSAIGEAHALGIIHRDLKPENVMLTTHNGLEDWVKVVDFGIAKMEPTEEPASISQANLTKTGAIMGTPLYMSPEQLRGRKADARSDIYSLGVIMYEMLTGKPPFASKNTAEIVVGHLNVVPDSPAKVRMDLTIPQAVSEVTMRALSKNPWERPTTVQEFANSLARSVDKSDRKKPLKQEQLDMKVDTPTPRGMVVDPVRKVCPSCKALSTGANFRYCLKCGQDNTNKWLPYHREEESRSNYLHKAGAGMRRLVSLVVLAAVSVWAVYAYVTHATELTGRFVGTVSPPLFSSAKLNPELAKRLQLSRVDLLLSQHGDSVSGLVTTKFGQDTVVGKVLQTSPMIVSYELTGSIHGADGNLDLEMTGTFDKIARADEWTIKSFFKGPRIKPITDVGTMHLKEIGE